MSEPLDSVPGLIAHLERYLGKMSNGYRVGSAASINSLQVAKFQNQPVRNAATFVTLGVSATPLEQLSGGFLRQEFIFAVKDSDSRSNEIPGLLATVGGEVISNKKVLLRGQVLGPSGPLLEGFDKTALYVTHPAYFPDGLHYFRDSSPEIVFSWLVPITSQEAKFVAEVGWEHFEDHLTSENPDLLDLSRESLRTTP
jgi:hypothetical protein